MHAEQLTGVVAGHGEGPVFDQRWAAPRWVDMLAGDVCELQHDGSVDRAHIGNVAAMLRPRIAAGWVAADEHGVLVCDQDSIHAVTRRVVTLNRDPAVRMNEGGCDPAGNLYLGSMAYDSRPGGGCLYRIDPTSAVTTVTERVSISNGIDWSPDDRSCYYVDSSTHRIDRFDWSAETGLTNRSTLVRLEEDPIFDGLTIDAEGNIWVAIFGGGRVHCYSPGGALAEVIEVAAHQVTAVTFAGPDLGELIITTSRHGLQGDAEPGAGAIFRVRPGTHGQPTRPFAG